MRFYSPIDMGGLEIVQFKTQNSAAQPYAAASTNKGAFWMDTANNLLRWSDGTDWRAIYRFEIAHVPGVSTAVLRDTSGNFTAGTISAALSGNATTATTLQTARNFSITGKAVAGSVSFNGSGDVALNVTALTVAPAEISITNGSFLLGGATGFGVATAKNAIPLSGFGAPTADVAMGGYKITGLADPASAQDAATKGYVDSTAQGLDVKASCRVATATALPAYTFSANVITASAVGALTVDGVAVVAGNRVLVKNESNYQYNGIYVVTNAGGASAAYVLTRASDFNTDATASPGSFTFIEEGSTLADTGWVMTSNAPITLNTSSIFWSQFSGAGSYTAYRGMALSGGQFSFAQNSDYTPNTIPYASGLTTIGFIAAGAANTVLRVPSGGGTPAFGAIDISQAAAVTGTLGATNGGTGQNTWATGDLLYASGANTLAKRAIGTANYALIVSGGVPTWGQISLTAAVTGTLPAGNGGTGTPYAQFTGGSALRTYSLPNLNAQLAAQVSGTITGNNSTTVFSATHNLNTKQVVAAIYDSADDKIMVDTKTFDANTVRFTFAVAPANGVVYRWVVVGY